MRTLYTAAFFVATLFTHAQAMISTTGENTFSPDLVSIELGESVTFVVMDGHTATQVSEETWLANGSDPMTGGFDYGEGTHVYTPTVDGIIYFVCQPHVEDGMKGQLHVINTVDINEEGMGTTFRIFPNPAANEIAIETDLNSGTLDLVDVLGKNVLRSQISIGQKLDVSDLPEGNYTAILRNSDGTEAGRTRIMIAR